jgi:glucose dehydrogenase
MGTLDAHLVAFDRMTGAVAWDVEVADPTYGYSITHAPLVVDDMVIIGVSGGEYGIRGHVTAYDAASGKQVWRWYSIPAPRGDPTFDAAAPNGWWGTWTPTTPDGANLNRNIAQEKADSAKYADAWTRGGGGVRRLPTILRPAYRSTFESITDLDGSIRPGDNLFTDAVVALNAKTGRTVWYYQTVPHDVWDLDATSPAAITKLGGRKVVAHAGKTAWLYVLDAATGQLVRRSDNFTPQENMFAQPTPEGTRIRERTAGRVVGSGGSDLNYAFVAGLMRLQTRMRWEQAASVAPRSSRSPARAVRLFSAINLARQIVWQNKVPQPMMVAPRHGRRAGVHGRQREHNADSKPGNSSGNSTAARDAIRRR